MFRLLNGLSIPKLVWIAWISSVLIKCQGSSSISNPEDSPMSLSSVVLGRFRIKWDTTHPFLMVTTRVVTGDQQYKEKVLFKTLETLPFLTVGYAVNLWNSNPIIDGNYRSNQWTLFETPYQNILSTELIEDSSDACVRGHSCRPYEFIIKGEVWGLVTSAMYEITLSIPSTTSDIGIDTLLNDQLQLNVKVFPTSGRVNRLYLNYWCDPKEKFYGFGTQFTHFNMKGHRIPIVVAEQGIGRGAQPTTFLLNILGDGAGGDWSSTYAPKLLYVTNFLRSIVVMNDDMMYADMRDDDSVIIEVWSNELTMRIIHGESVYEIVTQITEVTGRMSALPSWTQEGAIIGLEGGSTLVPSLVEQLTDVKYEMPIVGIWLQDWVGIRHAFDGDRLQWNWRLNEEYYSSWESMVRSWADEGIRVLTYVNPYFSFSHEIDKQRNIFQEGYENGYFLHAPGGIFPRPYVLNSGLIEFHMLDFSNAAARRWMKDIIKYEMIDKSLSSGWMADFGEYAPWDAVYYNDSDTIPSAAGAVATNGGSRHNLYPAEWAKLNHEAVQEARDEGILQRRKYFVNENSSRSNFIPKCSKCKTTASVKAPNDFVYFMRSGSLGSVKHTSSYWVGDQLVNWDGHDGIKSAVVGMLSSGLSGHTLTHSDIGGYTMHEVGPYPYIRTKELLFRWIELSAFGSALFRSHVGSSMDPLHGQIYDDDESILVFSKFAQIFAFLRCYREKLMEEATLLGHPLIRAMSFHYGQSAEVDDDHIEGDVDVWDITHQYMFGGDFLIAPVLDPAVPHSYMPWAHTFNATFTSSKKNLSKSYSRHHPASSFAGDAVSYVDVFIPSGTDWVHLWTGQVISLTEQHRGKYVKVPSPMGCPPVFYKANSPTGRSLRDFIVSKGWDAQRVERGAPILTVSSTNESNPLISQPDLNSVIYDVKPLIESIEYLEFSTVSLHQ